MKGLRLRDARASDRVPVFEFCKKTWPKYGDYVPRVWRSWIRDRTGRFIVAELDGTPVGIAKITDFGRGEIWLEGLRVDPKCRGTGIANTINREVLRTLTKMRPRAVRFCTGAENRASRWIGEKHGFEVVARFRYYWQKSRKGTPKGDVATRRDTGIIQGYIEQSRFLRLSSGLIAEGWIFREMSRPLLEEYIRRRSVMFLQRSGVVRGVAIYPYEENDDSTTLGFVDGDSMAIKVLARNCIYIAKAQGRAYCSAAVPTRGFARLVEDVGFVRKDSVGQIVFAYGGRGHRGPSPGKR